MYKWDLAPECVSLVILGIIWVYSRRSHLALSLKDRLFQWCFLVTFVATSSNILSTILIINYQHIPLFLNWVVATIYFIFTPLMGLVYFLYSLAIIYEGTQHFKKWASLFCLPGLLYLIMILFNPFTKVIFDINLNIGYVQGSYIYLTYIIFYAYCILSIIFVLIKRKQINSQIYYILSSFPIIAIIVILIQQFYPSIILSGSAATAALLIIYLHLQNKQIFVDYTTGLSNHLSLGQNLKIFIKNHQNFSLLILSLRDFKQINNVFGQHNGDLLLKSIAQYLSTLCGKENVFHFEGDEFAILVHKNNRDFILSIFRDIEEKFKHNWDINEMTCHLNYVIGVAHYPTSAQTFEDIVSAVESAVKSAKSSKISKVCYCDEKMYAQIRRKKEIVQILKDCIENKSFEMYYQPIINCKTHKYTYAESLMRINHSTLGPITPSEFIPIAEDNGLITDITFIILEKVCSFISELIKKDITIDAIHVNFSSLQFKQRHLTQKVINIIQKYNIPYSTIKIEITESIIAENLDTIREIALELQEYGISMTLDDFGTGYSNLSTVIDLPFSAIKLDRSLILSSMKDKRSAQVIKNIAYIFNDLGMNVVAEGVETKKQNDFIESCNVDYIQGYYYSKPMDEKQTINFFSSEH